MYSMALQLAIRGARSHFILAGCRLEMHVVQIFSLEESFCLLRTEMISNYFLEGSHNHSFPNNDEAAALGVILPKIVDEKQYRTQSRKRSVHRNKSCALNVGMHCDQGRMGSASLYEMLQENVNTLKF